MPPPPSRHRLAALRGFSAILRQPGVTWQAHAVVSPPRHPEASGVSSDLLADLQRRVAALEAHRDEDRVILKTVYRNAEGLITHVVEQRVTPDELAKAMAGALVET